MNNTMTVKEAAKLWDISERRVMILCKEGKIDGATKKGRSWVIPANAQKPADARYKKSQPVKASTRLPLPIGISDYRLAVTEYYYIDKTMLIKDFIDERPMVSLFTRPRRFGKTLNMDMLRTFFEKTDEDTSVYFKDKKIWACGKKYQEYQGKYPVIYLGFKDVKKESWEETYDAIAKIIRLEYKRHSKLADSERISDKTFYEKIVGFNANRNDYETSLFMLSQMLHEHYGKAPVIIIDEYDTPIQQGHVKGYYDEVIGFMRNLFSGGLKDNKHLSFGFMTGILRVAKESIFSGLNNLTINSILDNKYSEYFGFTQDEVKMMAEYYGAPEKYDEILAWYDGYKFGDTEIFNPWSVINYFRNECQARAYWQSTGSNDIIGEILGEATEDIYKRLNALLQGESFLTYIDTGVIYPQIKNNPSSVYSFLLVAGYLKVVRSDSAFGGDFMCEVALPNKEITFVYNKEILSKLNNIIPQATAIAIQEAIYSRDGESLQEQLGKLLIQSASCYDTAGENFYHGLVLGLCAMLDNRYIITSNRESGEGRYDISLCPKDSKMPGIIIELKAEKDADEKELKELAKAALKQIIDKKYDTEMQTKGIKNVVKYGVAFSGKHVEIACA
ncbi:MAG: AAA family ATPase [Clostridia bacterium]|nr:AAA family ATPase [Clostridia bacterium]